LPFIVWDIWAVQSGHWGFNPDYTLGTSLFGIAIEELLFFFTVPLVCLVIFLSISKHVVGKILLSKIFVGAIGLIGLLLATIWLEQGYTRTVGVALLMSSMVILIESRLLKQRSFWLFQLILFGLFVLANSVLTTLPIITYSDASMIGFRIGAIPIEDFAYNFALINSFIAIYVWRRT